MSSLRSRLDRVLKLNLGHVIHIRFHEDLPTRARNRLRYAMEMEEWRREWREAEEANDYEAMARLARTYEMVGLP